MWKMSGCETTGRDATKNLKTYKQQFTKRVGVKRDRFRRRYIIKKLARFQLMPRYEVASAVEGVLQRLTWFEISVAGFRVQSRCIRV